MIQELSQFVESLDPELKALGLKHKEGLHILLRIISDGQKNVMGIGSLVCSVYSKSKNLNAEELALLGRFSVLSQLSWCINTNKCFDLPAKAIHTCSPYCLAVKRENLINGEKYLANTSTGKSQVYERIDSYFAKGQELLEDESENRYLEVFKYAIGSEEKMHEWLDQIPAFSEMKDGEYVIFYLDESIKKYEKVHIKYLNDKLFNTPEYTIQQQKVLYGTSDFFNGFSIKKPFLKHKSASFDISGRISAKQAHSLYELQDLLSRKVLPCPLPIFIKQGALQTEFIALLKKNVNKDSVISYIQIIERLYQNHEKCEFSNFFLLFYQMGEIKDFDFVPIFEYDLLDDSGEPWKVENLFCYDYSPTIANVFDFQHSILVTIFNNSLISKIKSGGFLYKYFGDIEFSHCKSDLTYQHVTKYRRVFYEFIFKSKRDFVTKPMFDHILQTSIIEDMRLDEFKNDHHSQYQDIHKKLNIWFSLSEKFYSSNNLSKTMASKLKEHREFIQNLAKGVTSIEHDDQYAFTVGQIIAYLMSKGKIHDRSYQQLEPFLKQVKSKDLNRAIARMFDDCKHETFSKNFKIPFAEVLEYETNSIRELIPIILAGIFSENSLFSDKDVPRKEASTG